ncbi:MAG: phospholipid/cholesterol/gamma-HCH transport system substrate-binding protein [Thermoleophilaceae bacterium]|nr:phospholipid/cholesterol/gamma-HCH transport system substrate-binding protein [Thermoleophilaceae bacterium]
MRRGHEPRISPFTAGMITIAIVIAGTYFAFAKALPFRHHYELRAVMQNSNLVQPRSVVRIAGIDVGMVEKVERYRNTKLALVTMRIDDRGRPVHTDATLKVRPRLFLEGNFYVDLKPGTPATAELPDGGMIPLTQTARPVQLDEVLSGLPAATRSNLQKTLAGLGGALDARGGHAQTGAEALNATLATSTPALRGSAVVAQALIGPGSHGLAAAIRGFGRAAKAVADNGAQATSLVADLNTTMQALSADTPALEQAVALIGPTAASARRGFASLNASLPATRKFARDLVPGIKATPAAITASGPWIAQVKPLLGQAELGGWLHELRPAGKQLAALAAGTKRFLPSIDDFNRCITGVILPSGNVKIQDGTHSAGVENYKELWYAMVGQAGEGAGFDGNGSFLRLAAAPGDAMLQTGKTNYSGQSYFSTIARAPSGTRPAFTAKLPPLRRDVRCFKQPVPDVNGTGSLGPADGAQPNAPAPSIKTSGR